MIQDEFTNMPISKQLKSLRRKRKRLGLPIYSKPGRPKLVMSEAGRKEHTKQIKNRWLASLTSEQRSAYYYRNNHNRTARKQAREKRIARAIAILKANGYQVSRGGE